MIAHRPRKVGSTGSNPVRTTLIKLVYEQPLRCDALVRMEVKRHNEGWSPSP